MSALAAIRSVPRGTLLVGTGLLVLGLSSYGFLVISARAVGPTAFGALSVLYLLVYTIVPGLFLPYEQELARALTDRRARGLGAGPLLSRVVRSSAELIVLLLAVSAVLGAVVIDRLFDHSWALVAGLLISIVGLGVAYVSRGIFAGTAQFGAYGAQLALEGASRVAGCLALALAGVHSVGPYGIVLGGAFLVAIAGTAKRMVTVRQPGPAVSRAELGTTIRWLMAGALLSLALLNAGPVVVKAATAGRHGAAAGELLAGLVLARLPLFLFAAVQAALVPSLAAQLAHHRYSEFRTDLRRLIAVIVALTAVAIAVLAGAGPQLLHLFFGPNYDLGRGDLVLLGAATGAYMVAIACGNALLALQRFNWAAFGWVFGAAGFIVVLLLPLSLFQRVEYSYFAGGVVSAVAFGWLVRTGVARAAASSRPSANAGEAVGS